MKRLLVMMGCCLVTTMSAQEKVIQNVQYELMEGYSSSRAFAPRQLAIPDIPGYKTIKCDLHLHTHYSDGHVTPVMRVHEAYVEGLDAISITDHQPTPRLKSETDDCNVSFNQAKKLAESKGLILIKGLEITGVDPIGHLNVHFIKDCNDYMPADKKLTEAVVDDMLERAVAEGAYITTNHPGWPDKNSELTPFILRHIEKKNIRGIEIFNNEEFYPLAIDHANKYNLSQIGATDAHWPIAFLYDLNRTHRPMSLVFAKEKTSEAMKEALLAGRSIAWADDILTGQEVLLKSFLKASLKVVSYKVDKNRVYARIQNNTEIPYLLDNGNIDQRIRIPAHGFCDIVQNKAVINTSYKVKNMYVSSVDFLEIPLSYIFANLEEGEYPYVKEKSIKLTEEGLSFDLSCVEGETYYTLDGSEPTKESTRYVGTIHLKSSALLKACTYKEGKRSPIYERLMGFSSPVKCKAKKAGLSYRYYEGKFETVWDIEKKGELKKTGEVLKPTSDTMGQSDYYGFVFEGFIYAPTSGLYTFKLGSNDAADLCIGETQVVDNMDGETESYGRIYLQKGYHPVKFRFYEGYGSEFLTFAWLRPDGSCLETIPENHFFIQ
ncbi:MAG: chitobiase/beta-hexosaminidase C-terminal domain-containing protein [Parabacteroides sp.]|nr:chitobiase/beta-hexosaminidase C-terminal domain-containing protein [Parabacteroides sp.]